ncbi:MAG: hypothetical protein NVS2B7_38270 [Herpetosiphon sp.]
MHTTVVEFGSNAYPRPIDRPPNYLLSVRRSTLDPLLVQVAVQAGVTVRHGVRIEGLTWEHGRVTGVEGLDERGAPLCEQARLVVGADGRHSLIARSVAAAEYHVRPSPSGAFYAYFSGVGPTVVGADALQYVSGDTCEALCCPCDGGLHVVLLVVGEEEFVHVNGQGMATYLARLQTIRGLASRLQHAHCTSKLFRANPQELRGFFRVPYGPGWALVGDAGYYAHPASANGIADALRAGEVLHELVEQAWHADRPAETYLDHFQQTRDTENMGPFEFSYRLGQVNPFNDPQFAVVFTGGVPGIAAA